MIESAEVGEIPEYSGRACRVIWVHSSNSCTVEFLLGPARGTTAVVTFESLKREGES